MPAFVSHRKLLRAAHASATDHASAEASAQPTLTGPRLEPRLFMVEAPEDLARSKRSILRSIGEIDGGASISHSIPYRYGCAYTFFRGECIMLLAILDNLRMLTYSQPKFKQSVYFGVMNRSLLIFLQCRRSAENFTTKTKRGCNRHLFKSTPITMTTFRMLLAYSSIPEIPYTYFIIPTP